MIVRIIYDLSLNEVYMKYEHSLSRLKIRNHRLPRVLTSIFLGLTCIIDDMHDV